MVEHLHKANCTDCHWHGKITEVLRAENPFEPGDEILGCPRCHTVSHIVYACDFGDCKRDVSCGWLDAEGKYWSTCGAHMNTIPE